MADLTDIRLLKQTLKSLIKKKGYKYSDLATHLKTSLATVKRILNHDELSVSRLYEIVHWLGLSLAEVVELSESGGRATYPEFTDEQERFLAENSDFAVILEEVITGRSVEQIQKQYKLSRTSLEKYLLGLDRENLIELQPNGRVRRLVRNMKIRRGGPLSLLVAERLGEIAKENVDLGLTIGNKPPKFSFHFNTNLLMRVETLKRLHKEVEELAYRYNTLATTEQVVEIQENLTPVSWFFVVNNSAINQRLFDVPKNFPQRKRT